MYKNKKIKFLASTKHVLEVRDKPIPASSIIPEWWKQMPKYSHFQKRIMLAPGPTVTAKKCFPLLDAITAGYIVKLWADILVTQGNNGTYIQWNTSEPVVDSWSKEQSVNFEIPDNFSNTVFKYLHGWVIQTPKNYSCLITHPIGYSDLPFKTLTGIVDTDSLKTFIHSPFVVKKDFEGIIEKGTPMFQIIPFKRDNWESEYELMKDEEIYFNSEKLSSVINSYYGRFLRKNKRFI